MKIRMLIFTVVVLITVPCQLKAESTLSAAPGYRTYPVITVAGEPAAYSPGIHAFDRDSSGDLYIFSRNRIIKDPGGSSEVLFNYQTTATIYGSFIEVREDTVYFGESSLGTVRSVSVNGGEGRSLFTIPGFRPVPKEVRTGLDFTLTGNFACRFNSQSEMFLSANPGGFLGENKIYYWDGGTDPVIIADMGKYSGPIAFDRDDNLYYGFTGYPAGPEDVVYFTVAQVVEAIDAGIPLDSSDWTVLASGVDACSGLGIDDNADQNLYSTSSLGTLTRIDGAGSISELGGGSSPSILGFSGGSGDFAAFRPDSGRISVLCTDWLDYSSTIFVLEASARNFIIEGGDYDGSGRADIALFRPDNGLWALRGISRLYFGGPGDLPVSGDYTGAGTDLPAVFRESTGLWADTGGGRIYFGRENDLPIPRDYNGDGTADRALFRPENGLWAIRGISRRYFGREGDYPVPAAYESGDLRIGVFRPVSGLWAIAGLTKFYFGRRGDIPLPGDYDADGTAEAGIFRAATGLWAIRGVSRIYFGSGTDTAVNLDINPSTAVDIAIFRPGSGLWSIRGFTRVYYGGWEDFPAVR